MVSAVDRTKRDGEYGVPVARAFVRRIEIHSVVSQYNNNYTVVVSRPLRIGHHISVGATAPYPRACARKRNRAVRAPLERRRVGRRGEQSSTVCVCEALSFLRVAPSGPKIDEWTTSASSSPSSVVPCARFPGCPRATEVVGRLTCERASDRATSTTVFWVEEEMEVLKTSQEIVHEGWLIKSPPTKLWRARWRKRWFALRHSGELPGQYFLEYYTDRRCRKLKGRIDLDQCEQVDAGLRFENRKQKYQYMFNVKTPKRIYYLVAENEADMNKWVDAVCQVCGLKAYTQDEEQQMFQYESQESPPTSPTSTISGPYIPISECISGRRLNDTSSLNSALGQGPEHYDAPRKLAPSPPRSPTTTDAESVFTDDEWTTSVTNANWDTLPSTGDSRQSHGPGDEIGSWSVRKRFGKLRIDSTVPPAVEKLPAPPRPPKPPHMLPENPGHNYLNLDGATESSKPSTPATPAPTTPAAAATTTTGAVTDESYDFPRSHQPQATQTTVESNTAAIDQSSKHFYSNAAPSTINDETQNVFRYDFHEEEPSSPRSENSTTATYSNLPSPLVRDGCSSGVPTTMAPPPPMVYRELKPGRKTSDSMSVVSNEPSPGPTIALYDVSSAEHSPAEPPSINRKLKPSLNKSPVEAPHLQLASPPGRGRMRAAPSPTPPSHVHSIRHQSTSDEDNNAFEDKEEIYYYQDHNTFIPASNRLVVLQYLDLDLEATESFNSSTLPPAQSLPNTTVYKTVDFVKTEAFNRTRQRVEEERKLCTDDLT